MDNGHKKTYKRIAALAAALVIVVSFGLYRASDRLLKAEQLQEEEVASAAEERSIDADVTDTEEIVEIDLASLSEDVSDNDGIDESMMEDEIASEEIKEQDENAEAPYSEDIDDNVVSEKTADMEQESDQSAGEEDEQAGMDMLSGGENNIEAESDIENAEAEEPLTENAAEDIEDLEDSEDPDKLNGSEELDELVAEPAMPAQFFRVKASDGAIVTVDAPEGTLPEGAHVRVEVIKSDDVREAVEEQLEEGREIVSMAVYDITIYDREGNEIQPESSVRVTISSAQAQSGDDAQVFHITDDGTAEKVADLEDPSRASFETPD